MSFKRICVYCGASFNEDPQLKAAIDQLASELSLNRVALVYGGGSVGVMGLIADAMLAKGAEVIGVIPQFLLDKEVGHKSLTELVVTGNMHQRKQKMADLSDGFIILPGGFGTLEEFFEVLTWLQLGLHGKPVGILNVDGYYDHLLLQMDLMVDREFLKPANRALVLSDSDPRKLLQKMYDFAATAAENWFEDRNLT